jgi:predicted DCC family thiol-disulfide oxidoreductase YuxK
MKSTNNHHIVLFDGVCNLCNDSVNFIIRHDPKNTFKFAALQSDIGAELIKNHHIDPNKTDSIVLIQGAEHYIKSSAALRIARELSGGYALLFAFIIIPPFIRNWVYDFIARNRYKWYGRKESCMVPTAELRDRFL